MFVIDTTVNQEQAMIDFIDRNPFSGTTRDDFLSRNMLNENCTTAVCNVLKAGGVIEETNNPGQWLLLFDTPKRLEKALLLGELADLVIAIIFFDANEDPPHEERRKEE